MAGWSVGGKWLKGSLAAVAMVDPFFLAFDSQGLLPPDQRGGAPTSFFLTFDPQRLGGESWWREARPAFFLAFDPKGLRLAKGPVEWVDPFFLTLDLLQPTALPFGTPSDRCLFQGTVRHAGPPPERLRVDRMVQLLKDRLSLFPDLRPGDRLRVLFAERNGRCLQTPLLVRFRLSRSGETLTLVRYQGHYFWGDGRPLRSTWIPPVEGGRITSRFGERLHPILRKRHRHLGVDFAAPVGTPVRATADGKVAFIGYRKGYGRVIVLRHDRHRTTVYAHLSRFAKGLRRGVWVEQGQTIGFVGRSGLATGPHLHYELRVDGVPHDPLKPLRRAAAPPAGFHLHYRKLLARIGDLSFEVADTVTPAGLLADRLSGG